MCGRARTSSDISEIKLVFGIPPERPTPNVAPSWNVAPTDPLPVVYYDARAGQRSLDVMRWGLIPYWAKDIKIGFSTFNAPRRRDGRGGEALPGTRFPSASEGRAGQEAGRLFPDRHRHDQSACPLWKFDDDADRRAH
jgi:putative SOS response-associated peptidase YedK